MKISLDKLVDNPFNERKTTTKEAQEGIKTLADQMKRHGFLGSLLARPHGQKYQVAFGSRRLKAAKLAGIKEIEVEVKELSDQEMTEISTMENLQREDVDVFDRAAHLQAYMKKYDCSGNKAASVFGMGVGNANNYIRLLQVSEGSRRFVRNGTLGWRNVERLFVSGGDELIRTMAYSPLRGDKLERLAGVLNSMEASTRQRIVGQICAEEIDPESILISGLKYAVPKKDELKGLDANQLAKKLSQHLKDGAAALEVVAAQWEHFDSADKAILGLDATVMLDKLNQAKNDVPQLTKGN